MMSEGFQSASLTQFFSDKAENCRTYDAELATDLGSSLFFAADFNKFADLKNLLDSNKDALKLDAMRRIIEMVARGRDCSELFPAVVKNVVSKNPEVRKLVYIYLTRYAEEHQDIALLSVSTFQRSLKDPNPLVRGSALRVLSSIRIPMLVPIVMLALEEACKDISPYVRKLSAYTALKVYRLDPSEKERLIKVVEQLLTDKTTLVIGSAVWAFEGICPDRLDLIHPHYRRICALLMDVDEWGQVIMLDMLTRYARTQFLRPAQLATLSSAAVNRNNGPIETESFPLNSSQFAPEPTVSADVFNSTSNVETYSMEDALPVLQSDMDLLLHAARLLLHSQNTAVVVAVGKLLLTLESTDDFPAVAKAFVRCLHSCTEIQYTILCIIATLTINHRNLFEPYQRSFYVYSNDPLGVKLVKLEILTNLATEITIPTILREFQHYATSPDPEFVVATVQAIGRCASAIPQMADVCLNGLVRLMSRSDDKVVAECVVVLRRLLQMQTSDYKDIIIRIAQLTDTMTVPTALASILWLLGEYSHRVPKIAPDVLRKMAISFPDLEAVVKLQTLNLAAKLSIVNPHQTHLLAQYVFDLAKYDQNYDIRDRSRMLRALIFPQSLNATALGDPVDKQPTEDVQDESKPMPVGFLAKRARKICLAAKPAPVMQSASENRSAFTIGSLSHLLSKRLPGYTDIPNWPLIPPYPWSRVEPSTTSMLVSPGALSSSTSSSSVRENVPKIEDTATTIANFTSLDDFFSDSSESDAEGAENGNAWDELTSDEDIPQGHFNAPEDSSSDSEIDVKCHLKTSALSPDPPVENSSASSLPENLFKATTFNSADTQLASWLEDSTPSTETDDDGVESDEFFDFTIVTGRAQNQFASVGAGNSKSFINVAVNRTSEVPICVPSDPTPQQLCDAVSTDVIGTSSATLPLVCESAISSMLNKSGSTCPPSPSITLDSDICSVPVNMTPTPLPTVDDLLTTVEPGSFVEHTVTTTEQLLPPSPIDALKWYEPSNAVHSYFRLSYQFNRSILTHNPNLVSIRIRLRNQDEVIQLRDIHIDLCNSAIGRLLLDAKRITPFDAVDLLLPVSEQERTLGIDFAGFIDPIEINLVYQVSTEPSGRLTQWSILISPPAGELLRPLELDESAYFSIRDHLLQSDALDRFQTRWKSPLSDSCQTSSMTHFVLTHANASFRFSKLTQELSNSFTCGTHSALTNTESLSPFVTLFFSAKTIAENQPCLLEFRWSLERQSSNSILPNSRLSEPSQVVNYVLVTVLCSVSRFRSLLSTCIESAFHECVVDCECTGTL